MARVTVEDCVRRVANRFELVLLGAHRSRELSSGDEAGVPPDNDKNSVISLREIAEGLVDFDALAERIIARNQRVHWPEESQQRAELESGEDAPAEKETAVSSAPASVPGQKAGEGTADVAAHVSPDGAGESTAAETVSEQPVSSAAKDEARFFEDVDEGESRDL